MAKFEIGKRVIAIKNGDFNLFKKGDIRVVLDIVKCKCGEALDLGFHYPSPGICCKCGLHLSSNVLWCVQSFWEPLDELSNTTVEEVLENMNIVELVNEVDINPQTGEIKLKT